MISRIRVALIILIIIAAMVTVFEATRPYRPDNTVDEYVDSVLVRGVYAEPDPEEESESAPVYFELPEGTTDLGELMLVSEERIEYSNGDITLIIPSLEIDHLVQSGTSQAELKLGPGLFAASSMPGESGGNVSIAGHRSRNMFYYLDRLGADDRIQLTYKSKTYTYVFHDSKIVLPTDWSVIDDQGYDCCTLITCTPIGIANRRLVVSFILESVD